ncbi:MAG: tRNA glutamyl-Q(34) synthetase GluQRS [Pseudomonadota bacterium]|nr:tRNA glutamyl-Q(34) synthetase GluQRS [Pseudomonadota bacterium]
MLFNQLLRIATARFHRTPCGRYAPSPTGPQHLGNLRTALLAWLQARLTGGRFILRMDDLDRPRVREGSAEQVLDDLCWLGLEWDEGPDVGGPCGPYTQSERDPLYREAFRRLLKRGHLYPCGCSRKDIAEAASAPHEPGRSLRYPGTCRPAAPFVDESESVRHGAPPPAWRFRLEGETIQVEDRLAGKLNQNLETEVGDFVVRRRDGLFAYQLATVVDDALMGVTDVVRGLDLFDSTPRQVVLAKALDLPIPRYWHLPLMIDSERKRLAKRDGADSLQELRQAGAPPEEVVGRLAASCGLAAPGAELSAAELLDSLDLDGFRRRLQKGSDSSS